MNNRGAILLSVGYAAMLTALLTIIFATSIILVVQGTNRDEAHLQGTLKANNIIAQYKVSEDLHQLVGHSFQIEESSQYTGEIQIYKKGTYIVLDVSLGYNYSTKTDSVRVRGYKYVGQ